MKKRLLCLLLTAALMLGMVTGLASSAHAATKRQKSRAIAVVFDNSGSMYGSGNYNWCRATYAMEVFAAMMNEGDVLLVYPMHDVQLQKTGDKRSSLTINGPGEASTIRDIYTPISNGGTPFNPVEDAYNALKKSSADEKYLIVITDGRFEGSRLDDGTTIYSVSDVSQYLDGCANDMNVMFLGIGIDDFYMPTVSNSAAQYYTKAHSSGEVLDKLTAMCNRIFGRDELKVSSNRVNFDVSMSKIIVFVQGAGIENVSLSGGTKVSEHATKYSEYGCSGISPVDTSLQGMLVTYEDLDAGTYSISYTGTADNVCVYYEPDVDLVIQLVNSDGAVVDPSKELYAGSYRLEYGLVDKHGNFTDSKLLGNTSYDITYSIDGVSKTVTDNGSGSVDIELPAGSTLDGEFTVQYLEDYTITKDGDALGWPDGGLNIVPRPAGTVELQVSGGLDSYNLSSLEQDAVYQVSVSHDGKPVTGSELDRTTLNADLTGGNAQVKVQRTDSGYTVTVCYNGDAAGTDCGEYALTLSATYTLDQTAQSPDTVKNFTVTDDSKTLAANIALVQDYYVIKDIPESEPIYVNLTAGGAPLSPEAFANTSISVDIQGLEFDVAPDAANSRYIITLKGGDIESGTYTVTATVSGIDEIGRPVTVQDAADIELQPYPIIVVYLFWLLVALLVLILIWLYLNAKILPKHISVGPCTFIVDGDIVTGTAKCVYTGKNKRRGSLTVQSPHYGANPAAKCGFTLELEAVSPRRTRSAARSVQVVAVRPMSAANTIAVQIGGCNLSRDPISGKLMKAGGKPGAPLSFKIGNKAKTSVTAEVMDMANGGGEVTVSMSVPLKFL